MARAGVGRSRREAAQITKGVDRRQIQHVRLLVDITEDIATKINLSTDLLLDVLAYRLSARCAPVPTIKAAEPQPDPKTASTPNRKRENSPTCINVCDFGCTHQCAKTIGDNDAVYRPEG